MLGGKLRLVALPHLLDEVDLALVVPGELRVVVAVPARLVDVHVDVVGRDRRREVADACDERRAAAAVVLLEPQRPAILGGRAELAAVLV